jgi:GNAT superfamily N-acetyltransferase
METLTILPLNPEDREWVAPLLENSWGSINVVSRGVVHNAAGLPGFKAVLDGKNAGLATYRIAKGECELVTLDSLAEGHGVGSRLIEAVVAKAREKRCRRVWLITTNDNLKALHFYQKRGFLLAALHPGALAESRLLKPEIPLTGIDGIPLRDEIELEMVLD